MMIKHAAYSFIHLCCNLRSRFFQETTIKMLIPRLALQLIVSTSRAASSVCIKSSTRTVILPIFPFQMWSRRCHLVQPALVQQKAAIENVPLSDSDGETSEGNKSAKPVSINRFARILNCSKNEAAAVLEMYPALLKITKINLANRLRFLQVRGFTLDMIVDNPWLIMEDKKLLELRLHMLQRGSSADLASIVPLLRLPVSKLKLFLAWNKPFNLEEMNMERIEFLAEAFKCDTALVSELLCKYNFLQRLPVQRIHKHLNAFDKAGVARRDLITDPHILKHRPESIKPRLDEANASGMTRMKPWLPRSQLEKFIRCINRNREIREEMGSDPSIAHFLQRRLELEDLGAAITILQAYPNMANCTARKLGFTFRVLKQAGMTREQIIRCPRVLLVSNKTLLSRLNMLRALNFEPTSLSVLCFPRVQFDKFVSRLAAMGWGESSYV